MRRPPHLRQSEHTAMRHLCLSTLDPAYNLALEERLFNTLRPESSGLFLLWQNVPSVIVGRHQCTAEEVNAAFVKREGIPVVRRITGGGAVYHDRGNLNFSFIAHRDGPAKMDFRPRLEPVIAALAELGVRAVLSGRNDLETAGRKISGSSQLARGSRVLHHGTLLVDVDFDRLAAALTADPEKIRSKGVASVRARVGNIAEFWRPGNSMETLVKALLRHCAPDGPAALSPEDEAAAARLADEKYRQWRWNYGASPRYTEERRRRFPWGTVCLRLDVREGVIRDCGISGDFFAMRDIAELEALFVGKALRAEALSPALRDVSWADFFVGCKPEEMENFLAGNGSDAPC